MSHLNIGVRFDGDEILEFVQGEDLAVLLTLFDRDTGLPLDLTAATIGVNFPREGGGSVKRTNGSLSVVLPGAVDVAKNEITLKDHGLVTGDPVQLTVVTGGLPAPLIAATNYHIEVIDVDTFRIATTAGVAIVLTTQGTGSFLIVNQTDVVIGSSPDPVLGKVTLTLRALVTADIKDDIGQSFQVSYLKSGVERIVVLDNLLDVIMQPAP